MFHPSVSAATIEVPAAFSRRHRTALRQRSVIVMILLTIVTLGVYYPMWFLRRRAAFNQLDSPRKLHVWPFAVALAFAAVRFVVAITSGPRAPEASVDFLLSVAQLAVAILIVVQCFFIKTILEDHLVAPGSDRIGHFSDNSAELSGLMTVFFSIYYLQHVINTRVVTQ